MILAFVYARCIRINDYFIMGAIVQALFGFLDFVSDVVFAVQVTYILNHVHDKDSTTFLLLTVTSYLFIALPMSLGFLQLLRENQREWVHSVQIRNWMKKNSYFLYIISILSGSAFNTVALMNCEAFNLSICSMGLSKRKRIAFGSNRLWSVVIFEVKMFLLGHVVFASVGSKFTSSFFTDSDCSCLIMLPCLHRMSLNSYCKLFISPCSKRMRWPLSLQFSQQYPSW